MDWSLTTRGEDGLKVTRPVPKKDQDGLKGKMEYDLIFSATFHIFVLALKP